MFYIAKDALLECKRYSIQTLQLFYFTNINLTPMADSKKVKSSEDKTGFQKAKKKGG